MDYSIYEGQIVLKKGSFIQLSWNLHKKMAKYGNDGQADAEKDLWRVRMRCCFEEILRYPR